jgi:hypothetical protein
MYYLLLITCMLAPVGCFSQSFEKPSIIVETNLVAAVSGGYGIQLGLTAGKHWQLGIGISGGPIEGTAQDLVFEIEGDQPLKTDLPLILGFYGRYFFANNLSGVYTELSIGSEVFRIQSAGLVHENSNSFAVFKLGYLWKLNRKQDAGLFLTPAVGSNFIFNQVGERQLNGIKYRLNDVFINPSILMGWRF